MKNTLFDTADWLEVKNNNGYGQMPIPHPRDGEIKELITQWAALECDAREKNAAAIRENQRFTLLAFSERMAASAVREKNSELIFLGLLALGVDGWRIDWRDNTALLCLHYDAALKLNVRPDVVFGRAALLLSSKVGAALHEFLRRSAEDKALGAMGYIEGSDKDGFRYHRTW